MFHFFLFFPIFLMAGEGSLCKHAMVAVYAVHSKTGEVLRDENSDKSLIPASCLKIATTAAALNLLGPETRFQTDLAYDGKIDAQGVLLGNLYIIGGGDPCLGSSRVDGSLCWKEQLCVWAGAIKTAGIKRVKGRIIADASRWETAMAAPSWAWEDLGNYYGAGASALSFHENSYSLFLKPASKEGEPAHVLRTDPPFPLETLKNGIRTGPENSGDRACIYGSEFSPLQHLRGTIPAGVEEFVIKGSLSNPSELCSELLAKELMSIGIAVENNLCEPQGKQVVVHSTLSPTVRQIVHWTNQKSINLYAEHLLKKIGEQISNRGSTDAGVQAVMAYWKSQGIDIAGWNMADGSGLSRKNCVTAKQLVDILLKMKGSKYFPEFLESLPQIREGIRAKDGGMSHIRGYVGFAKEIAFAILVNQGLDRKAVEGEIERFFQFIN